MSGTVLVTNPMLTERDDMTRGRVGIVLLCMVLWSPAACRPRIHSQKVHPHRRSPVDGRFVRSLETPAPSPS